MRGQGIYFVRFLFLLVRSMKPSWLVIDGDRIRAKTVISKRLPRWGIDERASEREDPAAHSSITSERKLRQIPGERYFILIRTGTSNYPPRSGTELSKNVLGEPSRALDEYRTRD